MKCPDCGERRIIHPYKENECMGCVEERAAKEFDDYFNSLSPESQNRIMLLLNLSFNQQKPPEVKGNELD